MPACLVVSAFQLAKSRTKLPVSQQMGLWSGLERLLAAELPVAAQASSPIHQDGRDGGQQPAGAQQPQDVAPQGKSSYASHL